MPKIIRKSRSQRSINAKDRLIPKTVQSQRPLDRKTVRCQERIPLVHVHRTLFPEPRTRHTAARRRANLAGPRPVSSPGHYGAIDRSLGSIDLWHRTVFEIEWYMGSNGLWDRSIDLWLRSVFGINRSLGSIGIWDPSVFGIDRSLASNGLWDRLIFGFDRSLGSIALWDRSIIGVDTVK